MDKREKTTDFLGGHHSSSPRTKLYSTPHIVNELNVYKRFPMANLKSVRWRPKKIYLKVKNTVMQGDLPSTRSGNTDPSPAVKLRCRAVSIVSNYYFGFRKKSGIKKKIVCPGGRQPSTSSGAAPFIPKFFGTAPNRKPHSKIQIRLFQRFCCFSCTNINKINWGNSWHSISPSNNRRKYRLRTRWIHPTYHRSGENLP